MIKFYRAHDERYIKIDPKKLKIAHDASWFNDMPVRVYEDGSIHLHESNERGVGEYVFVNGDDVVDVVRTDTLHAWVGDVDLGTADDWGVDTIEELLELAASEFDRYVYRSNDAEIVILDDKRNVVASGKVYEYLN